jgi:hypothetical protein
MPNLNFHSSNAVTQKNCSSIWIGPHSDMLHVSKCSWDADVKMDVQQETNIFCLLSQWLDFRVYKNFITVYYHNSGLTLQDNLIIIHHNKSIPSPSMFRSIQILIFHIISKHIVKDIFSLLFRQSVSLL